MPEYFDKETNTEQTLDASVDIAMFGNLIAPKCGIKKRFVGSEPNCKITAQYNKQLGEKLVEYGIELIIIERISTEDKICDDIISATKVRKYLDEKDVNNQYSVFCEKYKEGVSKFIPLQKEKKKGGHDWLQ